MTKSPKGEAKEFRVSPKRSFDTVNRASQALLGCLTKPMMGETLHWLTSVSWCTRSSKEGSSCYYFTKLDTRPVITAFQVSEHVQNIGYLFALPLPLAMIVCIDLGVFCATVCYVNGATSVWNTNPGSTVTQFLIPIVHCTLQSLMWLQYWNDRVSCARQHQNWTPDFAIPTLWLNDGLQCAIENRNQETTVLGSLIAVIIFTLENSLCISFVLFPIIGKTTQWWWKIRRCQEGV